MQRNDEVGYKYGGMQTSGGDINMKSHNMGGYAETTKTITKNTS